MVNRVNANFSGKNAIQIGVHVLLTKRRTAKKQIEAQAENV